jgi:hypothetical protein
MCCGCHIKLSNSSARGLHGLQTQTEPHIVLKNSLTSQQHLLLPGLNRSQPHTQLPATQATSRGTPPYNCDIQTLQVCTVVSAFQARVPKSVPLGQFGASSWRPPPIFLCTGHVQLLSAELTVAFRSGQVCSGVPRVWCTVDGTHLGVLCVPCRLAPRSLLSQTTDPPPKDGSPTQRGMNELLVVAASD